MGRVAKAAVLHALIFKRLEFLGSEFLGFYIAQQGLVHFWGEVQADFWGICGVACPPVPFSP